jgi:hypothetical protein
MDSAVFQYKISVLVAALLMSALTNVPYAWGRGLNLSVKLSAAGASNTQDTSANEFQSYVTQSIGKFKSPISVSNIAIGGNSANSANRPENFVSQIQRSYDPTKSINILSLQFGGGNPGDITSDPASVATFYTNLVGIARKWKALGPNAKVVVYTTWGPGCADSATVENYAAANARILADKTNFDSVIVSAAASSELAPGTACPRVAISADCDHLTRIGSALLVPAYIAAVNSVY